MKAHEEQHSVRRMCRVMQAQPFVGKRRIRLFNVSKRSPVSVLRMPCLRTIFQNLFAGRGLRATQFLLF